MFLFLNVHEQKFELVNFIFVKTFLIYYLFDKFKKK